VSYGSEKLARTFLVIGLMALAAGGALVYLQPSDFNTFEWIMTAFTLAVGALLTLYGLARWLSPKPMLVLSPAGLRLHIDFVKTILIPWHEVHGVDSIDINGAVRGHTIVLRDVTVVLVTREFYDRDIHVDSSFMRGPGWDTNFIPTRVGGREMMQVALQHEALPTTAAGLRAQVEARWRAFREGKPASVPSVGGQRSIS
jgi:hypothetical protein